MSDATDARDAALADVRDHAAREWLHYAEQALHAVCFAKDEFTSDDVWEAMRLRHPWMKTHEPRALGTVMKNAAGKWCDPTDRTAASDNKRSHNRRRTIWRSRMRG